MTATDRFGGIDVMKVDLEEGGVQYFVETSNSDFINRQKVTGHTVEGKTIVLNGKQVVALTKDYNNLK